MTSHTSRSSDPGDRALAICGWSALSLLVLAVLVFGADQRLGLFSKTDPEAAKLAIHQRLDRIGRELGLSGQADTRSGALQKDAARLAGLRGEIEAHLRQYPRSLRGLYYQALERLAAGDTAGARAAAGRALELEPRYVDATLVLGVAFYTEKNLPEAEQAFRRAIEIEPQALSAYDNLGQTLWLMGRQDEATAIYKKRAEIEGLPVQN
jgi:tetratricopeptide (TPR) repeat protein